MTRPRFPTPAVATPQVMSWVTGSMYVAGGVSVLAIALDTARGAAGTTPRTALPSGLDSDVRAALGLLAIGLLACLVGGTVLHWGDRWSRAVHHLLTLTGSLFVALSGFLAPDPSTSTAVGGVVVLIAFVSFLHFAWPAAVAHLTIALTSTGVAMAHQADLRPSSLVTFGMVCLVVAVVVGRLSERASSAGLDPLTGLANSRGFDEALAPALDLARRTHRPLSVALLAVDHFAVVVQESGETAADRLLLGVADRWTAELPHGALLARRESDEFALILPDVDGAVALAVVERLRHHAPRVAFSCGVATLHPGETGSHLVRRADQASAAARFAGGDRGVLDDATPDPLLPELRRALATGHTGRVGLTVHYQAIVALAEHRVVGVEALARWRHPVHGPISPGRFIPMAEENGLITALGAVVLRQACQDLAGLHAATGRRLLLTVNVSGHQFCDPTFPATVRQVLAETGWPATSTVLEVTESLVEADSSVALASLACLRDLGVSVAIDDFGTGYSSLARLDTLPADYLKLDHSFTSSLTTSTRRARLMRSVMTLAESLELPLIAEGVETQEQADLLRELGCPLAQGYLFHRPSPADTLVELLTQEPSRATGPAAVRAVPRRPAAAGS